MNTIVKHVWRMPFAVALALLSIACSGGGDSKSNNPVAPTPTPTPVVTTVVVTPGTSTLAQGDTLGLTVSVQDATGATLSGKVAAWSSSSAAVATVSATGLVKAVAPGTAVITATVDGKTGTLALTVLTRMVKETDRATSATIGNAGGTITATSAAGVTYNFIVPALALDSSVRITVTPIARIGGLPFSGGLLGGVEFQPSGLKLGPGVQLVIKTSAAIPALGPNQRLVGFTFDGNVDSSSVQPAAPKNGGFAITVEHFSGGGLAVGNVADLQSLPTVPNGSIQQQRVAQLAALAMPQDLNAVIAIFKSWRTQIEALIASAQTGVDAKMAIDLYLNWKLTLEGFTGVAGSAAATTLTTALAGDRAALVAVTQAAVQRGIAQLNQRCVTLTNLLDAQNALYLRAYAEVFSNGELTVNGSGLTLTAQLATLCIQPVQSFASFPNTFAPNSSATLNMTYGVKFGSNPAAQGAFFDVTVTVSGAANNGTSTFQTDGTGRTLPRQIATSTTPITINVKSCLARSQIGITADLSQLVDVCHFSNFAGNPPEILSVFGAVAQIARPGSVILNNLESSSSTRLFRETQATLVNPLLADIVNPGTYTTTLSPGLIQPGTAVISYMLHADPVGEPDDDVIFSGSVTFLRDIVGVISTSSSLDATDVLLGAPGTAYPTGNDKRDAGVGPGSTDSDQISLSADRRTLSFVMQLKHIGQIRIVLKQ
jgi:Big-like domain-containing protein